MGLLRTSRNVAGHVRVLACSALEGDSRRRFRELSLVLHEAARVYREGGLPALESVLDSPCDALLAPGALDWALAQADAVAALLRPRPFRYCMRRAVLRYRVLRAAGHLTAFVIGAERNPGLDGHAWVEMDGLPFREEDDRPRRMTVVYRHECRMAPGASI